MAEWLSAKLMYLLENDENIAKSTDQVQQRLTELVLPGPNCNDVFDEVVIASLDIEALYPSISLAHCRWVIATILFSKLQHDWASFLIKMLDLVLLYNDIYYRGKFFRIVKGVPTGLPVSVIVTWLTCT